ncbi:MAG: FkbM family methyltransferase [Opitutaceae bacterium]|nr:FkbM family methyltransferase [Opitutaceae bacterium]
MRIVAFEPDEEECRRIEEGCRNAGIEVTAIARALGARRGRSQLYLAATRSGSSVYPPDLNTLSRYRYGSKRFDRHMATERQFPIDVDSLDAVCREYNLPVPDFIKINAEGSELDIINGGMESIRHAGGMQVELTFIPKFIGGCLFSDVDPVLRGAGYEFCDILTLNQFVPDTEALDFNSFAENTLLTWGPLGAGRKFTSAKFEGHFLYFNRTTAPTSWTHEHGLKALKTACLQEGFGHPAAAFQMLENLSRIAPDEMRHKLQDLLKEARLYFRRRGVASVE